jgi:hypothetical protein
MEMHKVIEDQMVAQGQGLQEQREMKQDLQTEHRQTRQHLKEEHRETREHLQERLHAEQQETRVQISNAGTLSLLPRSSLLTGRMQMSSIS